MDADPLATAAEKAHFQERRRLLRFVNNPSRTSQLSDPEVIRFYRQAVQRHTRQRLINDYSDPHIPAAVEILATEMKRRGLTLVDSL